MDWGGWCGGGGVGLVGEYGVGGKVLLVWEGCGGDMVKVCGVWKWVVMKGWRCGEVGDGEGVGDGG